MIYKSTQFWTRVSVVAFTVLISFYVLPLATPFVLSVVLTVLLWPVVDCIEYWGHKVMPRQYMPRWLAIIPALLLFALLVGLILQFVFIPFVSQLTRLVNNTPYMVGQFMAVFQYVQETYFNTALPSQIASIINTTIVRLGNYSVILAQKGIQAVFSLAGFLVELLLVPILTFYMLKDGRRLMQGFTSLFEGNTKIRVESVLQQIYHTTAGYIRGELFLAVDMFIIVFVGMTFFDIPYPLVLALIAAIAEWIPIIGPILGAAPAIILASLMSLPLAVNVAVFYLCVQFIDGQVIMPKVFGRFIKLHPIVIIAVIFIGGTVYGIKGMMLAVPVTAILQIFARELWYFNRRIEGEDKTHERC